MRIQKIFIIEGNEGYQKAKNFYEAYDAKTCKKN